MKKGEGRDIEKPASARFIGGICGTAVAQGTPATSCQKVACPTISTGATRFGWPAAFRTSHAKCESWFGFSLKIVEWLGAHGCLCNAHRRCARRNGQCWNSLIGPTSMGGAGGAKTIACLEKHVSFRRAFWLSGICVAGSCDFCFRLLFYAVVLIYFPLRKGFYFALFPRFIDFCSILFCCMLVFYWAWLQCAACVFVKFHSLLNIFH